MRSKLKSIAKQKLDSQLKSYITQRQIKRHGKETTEFVPKSEFRAQGRGNSHKFNKSATTAIYDILKVPADKRNAEEISYKDITKLMVNFKPFIDDIDENVIQAEINDQSVKKAAKIKHSVSSHANKWRLLAEKSVISDAINDAIANKLYIKGADFVNDWLNDYEGLENVDPSVISSVTQHIMQHGAKDFAKSFKNYKLLNAAAPIIREKLGSSIPIELEETLDAAERRAEKMAQQKHNHKWLLPIKRPPTKAHLRNFN